MTKELYILSAFSIGVILFSIFSWFPDPEVKDYVRTSLNVILCSFILKGHNWARWVMGVLLGLGGVTSLIVLAKLNVELSDQGYASIFIIVSMACLYISFAIVLVTQKFIPNHFRSENA